MLRRSRLDGSISCTSRLFELTLPEVERGARVFERRFAGVEFERAWSAACAVAKSAVEQPPRALELRLPGRSGRSGARLRRTWRRLPTLRRRVTAASASASGALVEKAAQLRDDGRHHRSLSIRSPTVKGMRSTSPPIGVEHLVGVLDPGDAFVVDRHRQRADARCRRGRRRWAVVGRPTRRTG